MDCGSSSSRGTEDVVTDSPWFGMDVLAHSSESVSSDMYNGMQRWKTSNMQEERLRQYMVNRLSQQSSQPQEKRGKTYGFYDPEVARRQGCVVYRTPDGSTVFATFVTPPVTHVPTSCELGIMVGDVTNVIRSWECGGLLSDCKTKNVDPKPFTPNPYRALEFIESFNPPAIEMQDVDLPKSTMDGYDYSRRLDEVKQKRKRPFGDGRH